MTEEQFTRAIEINNRLCNLQKVKEEISPSNKHKLTYVETGRNNDSICANWIIKNIGDILDKHDTQIREEIEAEIAALKKEIESL